MTAFDIPIARISAHRTQQAQYCCAAMAPATRPPPPPASAVAERLASRQRGTQVGKDGARFDISLARRELRPPSFGSRKALGITTLLALVTRARDAGSPRISIVVPNRIDLTLSEPMPAAFAASDLCQVLLECGSGRGVRESCQCRRDDAPSPRSGAERACRRFATQVASSSIATCSAEGGAAKRKHGRTLGIRASDAASASSLAIAVSSVTRLSRRSRSRIRRAPAQFSGASCLDLCCNRSSCFDLGRSRTPASTSQQALPIGVTVGPGAKQITRVGPANSGSISSRFRTVTASSTRHLSLVNPIGHVVKRAALRGPDVIENRARRRGRRAFCKRASSESTRSVLDERNGVVGSEDPVSKEFSPSSPETRYRRRAMKDARLASLRPKPRAKRGASKGPAGEAPHLHPAARSSSGAEDPYAFFWPHCSSSFESAVRRSPANSVARSPVERSSAAKPRDRKRCYAPEIILRVQ